jgi:hypothetical protein
MTPRFSVLLLLLGACAGDDGTEPPLETDCEGSGDPLVEVGSGGASGFQPFTDGTAVDIQLRGVEYGFVFDIRTAGLDTTASMSTLVRYRLGAETTTEDLLANLNLQCGDEGTGWAQVFASLPDDAQDEASAMALDGEAVALSVSLTDQTNEAGFTELELVLSWP